MVLKRFWNELDTDEPESSRRRLSLTCSDLKLYRDVTPEEIRSVFEPFFRKTVREEVEKSFLVLSPLQRGVSPISRDEARRGWMLRFVNQPPAKLFTGNKVEGKEGAPLQVEIVDVDSKTVVVAAPLSSLKLEIVVLHGDFDADQQEDQGENYFNSHVVRARDGKKPLIIGDMHALLKNGVAFIKNICFTDNSRWTKSAKFRLGVRVLRNSSEGFRVREAVSDAFKVKDRRGEACMKHTCPSLTDEVWRLKMIGKNGKFHQRLVSIGIKTVEDFLQMFKANPSLLKETLKCGNSNRTWNKIIKHATTCLSHDKEQYEDHNVAPKSFCSFNHNNAVDVLRKSQLEYCFQQVADDLEGYTSNNGFDQVSVDGAPIGCSPNLQFEPLIHSSPPLPCHDIPDVHPGQQGQEFATFVHSSSNLYGMDSQMEDHLPKRTLSDLHQEDDFFPRLSTGMSDEELRRWFLDEPPFETLTHSDLQTSVDPFFHTDSPNWLQNPLLSGQLSANIGESDTGIFSSLVPNNGSPRTAWCKLRAAVMCRIIIRQRRVMRAKKALPNNIF
ncbi:unnamed protein product [Rhodiola kirilowii]